MVNTFYLSVDTRKRLGRSSPLPAKAWDRWINAWSKKIKVSSVRIPLNVVGQLCLSVATEVSVLFSHADLLFDKNFRATGYRFTTACLVQGQNWAVRRLLRGQRQVARNANQPTPRDLVVNHTGEIRQHFLAFGIELRRDSLAGNQLNTIERNQYRPIFLAVNNFLWYSLRWPTPRNRLNRTHWGRGRNSPVFVFLW